VRKKKVKVLCTVGTRPEAIKMAPVILALKKDARFRPSVLATGQHDELLAQAFRDFGISPDDNLNVMRKNQELGKLSSRLIEKLCTYIKKVKPDIVLAQGDTTTVMATALSSFYEKVPFGHVEAGLRTGDRYYPFPEEMNRVLVSHLAAFHFAPTGCAVNNLKREGIPGSAIFLTGNTVIDAVRLILRKPLKLPVDVAPGSRMILLTAHRRENFGKPMREIFEAVKHIVKKNKDVELVYPVHPNPNVRDLAREMLGGEERVHLLPALSYPEFVRAMADAHLILSDSGGVQEEAPFLGKPVIILRDETEREEAVKAGTAVLAGPHRRKIVTSAQSLLDDRELYKKMASRKNLFGDGKAAQRIVRAIGRLMQ